MKIIDKIHEAEAEGRVYYSFEYFPPKTEAGTENLYLRIERMCSLTKPSFIDVTWGATGNVGNNTIEVAAIAQNLCCIDTQIHMTCTNNKIETIKANLQKARDFGIQNILALRGDPPKGADQWTQTEGGFRYAQDLIELIKKEHGDYFGVCCAGYPEGHPDGSYETDLQYLKGKVDAGADFVVTQLFYDCDEFLNFVKDARKAGINCPIVPGIMPIHTYGGFQRMTQFSKVKVPAFINKDLEQINVEDDDAVKAYGVKLAVQMCRYLVQNGVRGLHFYTLNLEKSVLAIIEQLDLLKDGQVESVPRPLPWKTTANAKRQNESVRPIFWSNRPLSYVMRTNQWDEFPNGRWGDSRSPSWGELTDNYVIGLNKLSTEERKQMWGGALQSVQDITQVFVNFLEGKITYLPWCEKPVEKETSVIQEQLLALNRKGIWTINSQPQVNGAPSDSKPHGWGPKGGRVYQKAYVEFFAAPEIVNKLQPLLAQYPSLTYHMVNKKGDSVSSSDRVNAVTWGVFPGREILQPTIVDQDSFLIWKDEAFALWKTKWAALYDSESQSASLIDTVCDTYYLCNIVENDFFEGNIFKIFEAL